MFDFCKQSVDELDGWLLSMGAVRLLPEEIQRFNRDSYKYGWSTRLPNNSDFIPIFILVGGRAPWRPPSLFVDPSYYLQLPHIEADGYVCVIPDNTPIDASKYKDVVLLMLRKAQQLLTRDWTEDELRSEFTDEFLSYWLRSSIVYGIRSLCAPNGPARSITVWRGKSYLLVGDKEDDINRWLDHSRGGKGINNLQNSFEEGLFLPLGHAPIPSEFPRSASHFMELIKRTSSDLEHIVKAAIIGRLKPLVIVCLIPTADGPALFSVEIMRPRPELRGLGRKVDVVGKGFRPGRVPAHIESLKVLGNAAVKFGKVERIDPSWVHGRDLALAVRDLHDSHVVIIGCGSVGSSVAMQLARSGVGKFTLIDPDNLEAANVGRHELGINNIGQRKAQALSYLMLDRFPHLNNVAVFSCRWEDALDKVPNLFNEVSLVISAMGQWQAEGALNFYLQSINKKMPVIYGWTEQFASAGHAVIISEGTGCLACGVDRFGTPLLQVSQWSVNEQRSEPACGSMFQPYGAIELAHINALISQAAIDALINNVEPTSQHRIWCAPKTIVEKNGGDWTEEWKKIVAQRQNGGFLEQKSWPSSSDCMVCGGE